MPPNNLANTKFPRYAIDLRLKAPAVDAPIDLTWRTVDTYQRALRTTTWGRPVAQRGGA